MSTEIITWVVPTKDLNPNVTYTINIYRSTMGEDGEYDLIDNVSAGSGNTTKTYTDDNGSISFFYYVRYVPSDTGTEGDLVLARIEPSVTELRLVRKVYSVLPEVIQVRMDDNNTQVRDAVQAALNMANAWAPVTNYQLTNMPPQYQTAVELGAQMFLYLEVYLQISIRDFSYGVSGISLAIDRGAKVNAAIANLNKFWMDFINKVKYLDYPDGSGLGSWAIAVPQARIFGALFGSGSGPG